MTRTLSRRTFLARSGWTAAGITIAATASGCSLVPAFPSRNELGETDAFTWLQLRPNGTFLFCSPRQEIGQGISSTLKLVLAGELGVDLERIEVIAPDTSIIAPAKSTVGSESIKDFLEPVTEIGQIMSATLHAHAGQRLKANAADVTFNGNEYVSRSGPRLSLVDLAAGTPILLDPNEAATSAPPSRSSQENHLPSSVPTDRITDIVTGAPLFAGDIQLPGLVYGAFIRAPHLGATLSKISFDAVPQDLVLARFFDGERAGLIAPTQTGLNEALEAVEANWVLTEPANQDAIETSLALTEPVSELEHVVLETSDKPDDDADIDLSISVPFAAHAAIEPRAALARWNDKSGPTLEIWTGTQDAFYVRSHISKHFGLGAEEVVVYSHRVGGGFGGRTLCNVELEAALLAKEAGRPVKVQWTRPDEFQEGFHRPPSKHRIQASANEAGRLTDWSHGFRSGHVIFTSAAMPPWIQALTSFTSDPGTARGAHLPYAAERAEVAFSDIRMPVKTGPWRGLGAAPNTFAIETAIDRLATNKGIDPLTFRLANLPPEHERLSTCLEQVAKNANWQGRSKTEKSARGIACGIYKGMTYVAVIADVDIDRDSGTFQVTHLTCAHDCGRVINPDQVRAQIEGNLIWGLGMVKSEELTVDRGRLSADYLGDYQIPTIADAPAISIELIEPANAAPVGAGEAAIVASGAAIANAVAALTGKPITALPIHLQ
ncbi:molybdopterin-dependent oxidoreductase [Parvibaculaceae bacterium PLY_AMNH_Bact1]|nr:molybdopterin-dependent oxidoreductase [Parvibaculaceae bacterium PLY_AMNH_Bact1]